MDSTSPLLCHRCGRTLHPGRGDFFVVNIEAMADPSPPALPETPPDDLRQEIERTLEQIDRIPEQELMDQVHRRLTMHLCAACFKPWIENPAGG